MSVHEIYMIGGDDDEVATVFAEPCSERGQLCRVIFKYRGRAIEESASDYFEAFARIRTRLEEERLIPFCYGASLNVYPSGMSRDMGSGLVAYRLTMGQKPTRDDLVKIFEEGADVIPASVSNQKAYFDEWFRDATSGKA